MDEKLYALFEMTQMQVVAELFFKAETAKASNDYKLARPIYADYIANSKEYLIAALGFNRNHPDSPCDIEPIAQPLINALLVMADLVQDLGGRDTAITLREEAIELSQEHLGSAGSVETERSLAGALTLEGRFHEAIVALMRARDMCTAQNDPIMASRVAIDLADILQWLGDFSRAREEIRHAEMMIQTTLAVEQVGYDTLLTGVMASISSILSGQGDSGEAMRATHLYRAATEITFYQGLIAKAQETWEEAEQCMKAVLPEYRKLGSGEAIEFQLAQIKIGQGLVSEGLNIIRRIEPKFYHGAFRPKRGILQRLQAECLLSQGDGEEARRLVDESIADLTEVHFDPDALWRSQWFRAQIAIQEGDTEQVVGYLKNTMHTIGFLRRAPLGYRLDSTFLADKKKVFGEAIQQALASGAVIESCGFMESLKSRTLSSVLSIPKQPSRSGPSRLETQLDDTTRQLDAMEYKAYLEGWGDRRAVHRDLLSQRADLLERIRISDPRWRRLSEPLKIDWDDIFRILAKRSQAVLMLHLEHGELSAVLLFNGHAKGAQMRIQDKVLTDLADFTRNLQRPSSNPYKHDFSLEYKVDASDLIPHDLLREALSAASVVVVPHGPLHLLPWAGLIHEERRLFEQLPVGILPNINTLSAISAPAPPTQVALFGISAYPGMEKLKDLPSVKDEIEDIDAIYRGANIHILGPLMDEAATEPAFWDLIQRTGGEGNILHISCHGTIVPYEPMNSGLLLFDAKIDAAEVARTRLPFAEVVLSACSTGWRPTKVRDVILDADEILGIPSGFLEAGASAVLVSISKAEDKAAWSLTAHYHRRRVAGDAPLEAFRAAQQKLLDKGVPPGNWMGFAMYGCH